MRHPAVAGERIGWTVALILGTLAVFVSQSGVPGASRHSALPHAQRVAAQRLSGEVLDSAVELVVANNPFRLSRRPSAVPFGSERMAGAVVEPPREPRPQLVLAGIVGGPPWVALLDGVPGRQGSVAVRQGDTVNALFIKEITRQGAVVTGSDTLWVLSLRRIAP